MKNYESERVVGQLELMQQREDLVPPRIDQMFQERYGFHFNKE